ncbi:hypothetical protein TNCV_3824461 [Trichonephila clavipes]|nr:hypothetical protein TNCV_3824461 [Trichonephila clavipes]
MHVKDIEAQMSSRWCGMAVKREGMESQVSSLLVDHGSKLRVPSPIALKQLLKESLPEPHEFGNVIKVDDLARKINLEVNSDGVQELPIEEIIKIHEQVIELESFDPVQSEDLMMLWNSTESLSLIGKKLQILENTVSNEERIFLTKQGITKLLEWY